MNRALQGSAPQRGMALVLSLIFLAIVTLVSLSSMQGSVIQGRMAANQQEYSVALQAAEAALRAGEQALQAGTETGIVKCGSSSEPAWKPHASTVNGQSLSSRYRICDLVIVGSRATSDGQEVREVLYRIEAQGAGRSEATSVALESLFAHEQREGS
ncbi:MULTISPECIES: PilX N-terminal domain-containing pilus assembly protein [unclassified Halomonas]|uniref:pilus assembly PilX family protein n=1 Tax=unclassified Halomonas TaxID=2609666 RepID=UPI00209D5536|nr:MULTISPECIES: PilX N-terminal domain-containing pilus assembly protein [unclassified Halomonas]MCP1315262.1 PilX N-terminal domain-containing pilus assembly protein [Halomonas sp. 707D7]MCP1327346.1 PilX N-terminal domain-containing pilus assembly protein [Halomonas sp. 707D4]